MKRHLTFVFLFGLEVVTLAQTKDEFIISYLEKINLNKVENLTSYHLRNSITSYKDYAPAANSLWETYYKKNKDPKYVRLGSLASKQVIATIYTEKGESYKIENDSRKEVKRKRYKGVFYNLWHLNFEVVRLVAHAQGEGNLVYIGETDFLDRRCYEFTAYFEGNPDKSYFYFNIDTGMLYGHIAPDQWTNIYEDYNMVNEILVPNKMTMFKGTELSEYHFYDFEIDLNVDESLFD